MNNQDIIFLCFIAYILLSTLLSILYFKRVLKMRNINRQLSDLLNIRQQLSMSEEKNMLLSKKKETLNHKLKPLLHLPGKLQNMKEQLTKIENEKIQVSERASELEQKIRPLKGLPATLQKVTQQAAEYASKINEYENRFSDQISVEEQLRSAKQNASSEIKNLLNEIQKRKATLADLEDDIEKQNAILFKLNADLDVVSSEHELFLDGYKHPAFQFDDHAVYVMAVKKIREKQKDVIRRKEAVVCPTEWTVGDSKREGAKAINRLTRLTLRAFNNECDLMIKNLTWKNAERTKDKIWRLAEILDGLNESMHVTITARYIGLKIQEVDLVNEEKLKKEEEKERLRAQRELEREEAKAQREYLAEVKRQEKLERDKEIALKAARDRLAIASEEHRAAVALEIANIETELSEAILAKGKLLSMAEQTRIGHVYVISNRGSFGDRMVKIGMTRRLEPMDRVKELGDASVPFPFDVHAIIFSEDAPKLEKELHSEFASSRVNKVNNRKEFFHLKLEELEQVLQRKIPDIPFERNSPSLEYVQSQSESLH